MLPESQIVRNQAYVPGGTTDQSLDLYLPEKKGGPAIVFVHGGGWNSGDKELRAGGLDVYGNIGRFYASQGIATAVINYRLMPNVGWREQRADVAQAAAWVHDNAQRFGYDGDRIFLMGHSAGAQLAAHVALNDAIQRAAGLPSGALKGFIVVSGAGLDLTDKETYRTEDPRYYEKRFGKRAEADDWRQASPITYVDESDPPALVFFGEAESKGIKRQALVFYAALRDVGVPVRLIGVRGESHKRIVLVLSHPDKAPAGEILKFVTSTP